MLKHDEPNLEQYAIEVTLEPAITLQDELPSKRYDETQFDEDLAELERLMNEIKKPKAETAEKQGLAQASLTII